MNLETLLAKRAVMVAQRDQLNANMNAMHGAVAVYDELIGEMQKAAQQEKEAAKWLIEALAEPSRDPFCEAPSDNMAPMCS